MTMNTVVDMTHASVAARQVLVQQRLAAGLLTLEALQTSVDNLLELTAVLLEQDRRDAEAEGYFRELEARVLELARIAQQQH
jgi:hypothetical protein